MVHLSCGLLFFNEIEQKRANFWLGVQYHLKITAGSASANVYLKMECYVKLHYLSFYINKIMKKYDLFLPHLKIPVV